MRRFRKTIPKNIPEKEKCMNQEQLGNRQARAENEPLVISRTDEGFRVYSPANATRSYVVSGSVQAPSCTCPDFQCHEGDLSWRCKHILAVLSQVGGPESDTYASAERQAIQEESGTTADPPTNGSAHQMVIKRSVSPDKRIDSLSVEFSCPVGTGASEDKIRSHAVDVLKLQDSIVKSFLCTNGKGAPATTAPQNGGNGAIAARMLNIAGMNTKYGRRLFIAIESDGRSLKFFGSPKLLADAITSAGFPNMAGRIDEGIQLNLPCRIIIKPSPDGRYMDVERVFPADQRR